MFKTKNTMVKMGLANFTVDFVSFERYQLTLEDFKVSIIQNVASSVYGVWDLRYCNLNYWLWIWQKKLTKTHSKSKNLNLLYFARSMRFYRP